MHFNMQCSLACKFITWLEDCGTALVSRADITRFRTQKLYLDGKQKLKSRHLVMLLCVYVAYTLAQSVCFRSAILGGFKTVHEQHARFLARYIGIDSQHGHA